MQHKKVIEEIEFEIKRIAFLKHLRKNGCILLREGKNILFIGINTAEKHRRCRGTEKC